MSMLRDGLNESRRDVAYRSIATTHNTSTFSSSVSGSKVSSLTREVIKITRVGNYCTALVDNEPT
jgi:hypothetical protein